MISSHTLVWLSPGFYSWSPLHWVYRRLSRCSRPEHITALAFFSASLTRSFATGSLCLSPRRNGTLCTNHMSHAHSCPPWAAQQLKQIPPMRSSAVSAPGFPAHLFGCTGRRKQADFVTIPKLNEHTCLCLEGISY